MRERKLNHKRSQMVGAWAIAKAIGSVAVTKHKSEHATERESDCGW